MTVTRKFLSVAMFAAAALAIAMSMFAAQSARAHGIVYVNIDRVYQESKVIQEVRGAINADFKEREDALRSQGEEIRQEGESLEKDALTLDEAELESRRAELEKLDRSFARDRRALVEDRGVVMQERRRLIDIEVAKVIEAIAAEREYAMVLNPFVVLPAGNRTYTHASFFYADEEQTDITADVIARFDAEAKADSFQK